MSTSDEAGASALSFNGVSKGFADTPALDHDWTPYYGLEIDVSSGAFLVALNKEQTRFLRSWRHDSPCGHCGGSTSAIATDRQQSTAPRRLAPT